MPLTWGSPGRISRRRSRLRRRSGCSTTCTRPGAPAAGRMPRAARRACRIRAVHRAGGGPWRFTWSSSSMCRWSGAGTHRRRDRRCRLRRVCPTPAWRRRRPWPARWWRCIRALITAAPCGSSTRQRRGPVRPGRRRECMARFTGRLLRLLARVPQPGGDGRTPGPPAFAGIVIFDGTRTMCAMRRTAISPAAAGRDERSYPEDLMAYSEPKGRPRKIVCQETGDLCPGVRAACREIRAIWRKFVSPESQSSEVQRYQRWKDARNRRRSSSREVQ